jgi:Pyruvate/2-oxoacid:ferredoxin oxidoreductase gamma subunit
MVDELTPIKRICVFGVGGMGVCFGGRIIIEAIGRLQSQLTHVALQQ